MPAQLRRHSCWLALPAALVAGCVSHVGPSAYLGDDFFPAAPPVRPAAAVVPLPLLPMAIRVGADRSPQDGSSSPRISRVLTVVNEPPPDRHVVAAGETLIAIARDRLGDAARWHDILALNPGLTPTGLSVGKSLVLPR